MKTHMTSQGKITIPKTLRRKYGIRQGTRIVVTDVDGSITLRPMTDPYFRRLQGSLNGMGAFKALMDERHKDKG
jgi:AbrB family looped-hinge helix DNA binding protein